jgi:dienelactone hydrolase
MRLALLSLLLAFLTFGSPASAEPIKLQAADGVTIYAEVWRAPDKPNGMKPPVILAFHQAGSNHAEYETIAPRLVAAGFTVLAIDQRSGGNMFGTPNRTAAALSRQYQYREVMPDLEAALLWGHASAMGAPVIALGSSYSASLIFQLAARHPGALAALVAFSPGEYLDGPAVVHDAARSVKIPVLVDSAKNPEEIAAAKSILDAVASDHKQQIVPHSGGVHGASTLRADKDPAGAEENFHALLAFLAPFAAS